MDDNNNKKIKFDKNWKKNTYNPYFIAYYNKDLNLIYTHGFASKNEYLLTDDICFFVGTKTTKVTKKILKEKIQQINK